MSPFKAYFKAIVPPGPIVDAQAVKAAIEAEAAKVGADILSDFQATTAGWNHYVRFNLNVKTGAIVSVSITTNDMIYGFMDKGTKPHWVYPRANKFLRMWINGGPVYRKVARVDGIKAHHYADAIHRKRNAEFSGRIQAAVNKAIEQAATNRAMGA